MSSQVQLQRRPAVFVRYMDVDMEIDMVSTNTGAVHLPRNFPRFSEYKSHYCNWDDMYRATQCLSRCLTHVGISVDLDTLSADSTIVVGGKSYTHKTTIGEFLDAVSSNIRELGFVVVIYASDEYDFTVVPLSLVESNEELQIHAAIQEYEQSAPDEYSDADLA